MSTDAQSAVDSAYARIRQLITDGNYHAGDRLKEEDLAQLVGASRTPVRQALGRLNSEGLVTMFKNRGAYVAEFSAEDAREIFELRSRLEPYAARLAAARCDPTVLCRLTELADQMEALDLAHPESVESMTALNNKFHEAVTLASGSTRIRDMLRGLVNATLVLRTFSVYDEAAWRRSLAHHREIIEALQSGDPDWAESVMHTHIIVGAGQYLGQLQDG